MSGPALSVPGRGEQPLNQFLIGLWGSVRQECFCLLRSWRESGKIEIKPPDKGALVRLRSRLEVLGFQASEDKGVHWRSAPAGLCRPRRLRRVQRSESPVIGSLKCAAARDDQNDRQPQQYTPQQCTLHKV